MRFIITIIMMIIRNLLRRPIINYPRRYFTQHKYSNKSSKEIERQAAQLKWKNLQRDYKAVDSKFGLNLPNSEDLQAKTFLRPDKIEFSLQALRICSRKFPVYLYWQLKDEKSLFHVTIEKMTTTLWQAQKKQVFEILQFLYTWKYEKIDALELYQRIVMRFELEMSEIFYLFKLVGDHHQSLLENKVLERLRKYDLQSSDYQSLTKILNFLVIQGALKKNFYIAITASISENISKISPSNAIKIYIFYSYNAYLEGEFIEEEEEGESINLVKSVLQIVEERVFECLKFLSGEEIVALVQTYHKNIITFHKVNINERLNAIIDRIDLMYFSDEFGPEEKVKLLKMSQQFPTQKSNLIIAHGQRQLIKKKQKFSSLVLVELYLASYQSNMLTQQIISLLQQCILENIFSMNHEDVSRAAWLFTVAGGEKRQTTIKLLNRKLIDIIKGGLRDYQLKDIAVMIWSMGSWDIQKDNSHLENIESYVQEQINRKIDRGDKDLIHDISWILWGYLNNYPLSLKTIDTCTNVILHASQFSLQSTFNVFQLINVISFYHCIQVPPQMVPIVDRVKQLCFRQFKLLYSTMSTIQLCKGIKFMGYQIWRDRQLTKGIIAHIESIVPELSYQDLTVVIGLILNSPLKGARIEVFLGTLMRRKKQLQQIDIKQKQI